jgi:hypothetical protein
MSIKALIIPLLLAVLFITPTRGATTGDKNSAEANGSLSGTIKDSAGEVLQGAQIVLQPAGTAAASNAQGYYQFRYLQPGSYTVTVSYAGFTTSNTDVDVSSGATTLVNVTLTVGATSQQVVVSANLEGDAAAINEQRVSENILNVQTDTQIAALPNANIADALGRMPGVTLQRNEGEGQYVQIRGTEPRLSNTTIDGVVVPGPDPDVRQVDLDTIPADLVGSVAINKTLSANQDGDAIGGSVDLRIKQATSDRPTLSFEGVDGNTPIDNQRQTFLITSSAGMRFGPDKRWGVMLGYSYDYNSRGIDDVEPVPDLNPDLTTTYDAENIQEYLYDRTRYGFAGSVDYKLNETSDLYVHGLFSNFRDYGQKYAYKLSGVPPGQPPDSGGSAFSTSVRRPDLQIADLAIGGLQSFLRQVSNCSGAFALRGCRWQPRRGLQYFDRKRLRLQRKFDYQPISAPIHLCGRGQSYLRSYAIPAKRHQPHHRTGDAAQSASRRCDGNQLPSRHAHIDVGVRRTDSQRAQGSRCLFANL